MHCELVVPGLLARHLIEPGDLPPMPALERLLARAHARESDEITPEDWLAHALGMGTGTLPAGVLARASMAQAVPGPEEIWLRLDPVHLKLGRESLTLLPGVALDLRMGEAQTLCASLSAHFGNLFAQGPIPASADAWCARLHRPTGAGHAPPIALCGTDVDAHLRTGDLPAFWHAFMNEAQMLLHTHPVNEAREARGELPVNSVWPWGAGALVEEDAPPEARLQAAPLPWTSVTATDPTAAGLASACARRHAPLPVHAASWLTACGDEGRHLVWLDQLRAPASLGEHERWIEHCAMLERAWFVPLLDALSTARIGMISLHVPDLPGCTSFELARADLRRFWRRIRPLSHHMRARHADGDG
jgi:hypothetical protein